MTKGSLILRRGGRGAKEGRGKGESLTKRAYSACVQLEPKAAMAAEARERAYRVEHKNLAKFSDTCSVRTNGLCIGSPRLVGGTKAGNSNMQ